MRRISWRTLRFCTPALVVLLAAQLPALAANGRVPAKEWEKWEKPESAGYHSARLDAVRAWLRSLDTTALMVVVGGKSLLEYGDLAHVSYLASVRKSVLAMLYGRYVESGVIPLHKTLREIGINDTPALLPQELEATVEHLITARSGIYHPASNPGDSTDSAPPRGSQRPGAYFLYNNWDFNAAGAAFEKLTGQDIFDTLERDLARPLEMQDFDRSRHRKTGDPQRSVHLAYHMHFSTRDMARVGHLMLREGKWGDKQLVPRDWARRITSVVTPYHEMNPPSQRALGVASRWAYGYMWWVWDAPNSAGPFRGAYQGVGAGGQFITVLPQLDMVIAHKTDVRQPSEHRKGGQRRVLLGEHQATLDMLIASRCSGPCE